MSQWVLSALSLSLFLCAGGGVIVTEDNRNTEEKESIYLFLYAFLPLSDCFLSSVTLLRVRKLERERETVWVWAREREGDINRLWEQCSSTWCRCSPWWQPITPTTSPLIIFNRFFLFPTALPLWPFIGSFSFPIWLTPYICFLLGYWIHIHLGFILKLLGLMNRLIFV